MPSPSCLVSPSFLPSINLFVEEKEKKKKENEKKGGKGEEGKKDISSVPGTMLDTLETDCIHSSDEETACIHVV